MYIRIFRFAQRTSPHILALTLYVSTLHISDPAFCLYTYVNMYVCKNLSFRKNSPHILALTPSVSTLHTSDLAFRLHTY